MWGNVKPTLLALFVLFPYRGVSETNCSLSCKNTAECEKKAADFPAGTRLEPADSSPALFVSHDKSVARCGVKSSVYQKNHYIHHLIVDEPVIDSPIVVSGFSAHGGDNSSVKGPCPLFHLLDNAVLKNLNLECLNTGEPAIEIKGKNIVIENVSVPVNKFLARAIDNYHLDVGELNIALSTGTLVFANIAPGSTITVNCADERTFDTLVVTQRTGTALQPTSCSTVSLDAVLSPLGTQYEIDYLYRNAEIDPENELFRWGVFLYTLVVIAIFLYTVVTREAELRLVILGSRFYKIKTAIDAFSDS